MTAKETRSNRKHKAMAGMLCHKWSLLVVQAVQSDTIRFSELNRRLKGISQKVLTETLRKLERDGILYRTVYPTIPPQVEYKLTSIGLDLLDLSGVLSEWIASHEDEIKKAQRSYDRRKNTRKVKT